MAKFRSATLATTALSAAAFLAAIATSNPVDAALISQVSFSTNGGATFSAPVQVADQGAGDLDANVGALLSTLSVGGIRVILNTATGFPEQAYPSLTTTFSATGTVTTATILRIEFTQTGNPNTSGTNLGVGLSATSLLNIPQVVLSGFAARSDAPFSTNILLATTTRTSTGGQDFSQYFIPGANPTFSETLRADIYFTANTASSGGGALSITAVPEPMTIALLGAGLLGLGVARSRRRG